MTASTPNQTDPSQAARAPEELDGSSSRWGSRSEPPSIGDVAWDRFMQALIVASVGLLAYLTLGSPLLHSLLEAVEQSRWAVFVERPSLLWAAMGVVLLGIRTGLWFHYRPAEAATMEDAPPLTVIIPAYNEGEMVARSIESVARARYPQGKLEIFVVDDGSTDDTWEHIERAAAWHPGLVTTHRFPRNRGKRAALAAGFSRARGEVVITIDSDSVVEEGALLAMAGAFRDPKVGAVAGKVLVYNRGAGIIPQMLHVRFVLSFDLLRAAQSTYRTVYCVPGALAGYRTSVVRRVLEPWLAQSFLGAPCTFGEDRALTNSILEAGYDTLYQRTAVVHTVVPTTYARLCKMFIRWERSFVREELRFARIVWRRPLVARLLALFDTSVTNLRYPISYASLALFVSVAVAQPMALVRMAIAIGFVSFLNMLYYLRTERSWSFLYGILYAYFWCVGLFWIFPYSALTVRSRSWLTR